MVVDENLLQLNEESLLTALLFGNKIYNDQVHVQILNVSVGYIIESNKFTGFLFYVSFCFFCLYFQTKYTKVTEMHLLLTEFQYCHCNC